jgi:hypothetical protein
MPSDRASQEPILTKEELTQVNNVIQWSQTHEESVYFGVLVTVLRLMEFVYETNVTWATSRSVGESARVSVDPSPSVANTRGATP